MRLKRCTKCGESQPHDKFYNNKTTKDGLQAWCKTCWAENQRRYRATTKGRAIMKSYRDPRLATEIGRAAESARVMRRYNKHPWKLRVGNIIGHAVKAGKILPAAKHPCSERDETCHGRHEWHHDSYRECDWMSVRALCKSHHRRWHLSNTPTVYDGATA